jgi:TetR/AcrR family transcriptional regulator
MRALTITSGSPGRPLASLDRDARALLLTAASELFAEQGVAATTFATIAKRAGLTPAMVHYYFKDREQLLDAVVEEKLCPFIAHVWDPVQPGGGPAELIRGIVGRLLTGIERAPWVPSAWMREILNEGGLLRGRVLRRIPIDKVRVVGEAIRQGQAAETANPDIDPLLMVFSTFGLVMLHMATVEVWAEIFQRKPLSGEVIGRHINGLLLDGLRGPGRPPEGLLRESEVPGGRGGVPPPPK